MSGEVGVDGFVDTSANGKWWALEALYVERGKFNILHECE